MSSLPSADLHVATVVSRKGRDPPPLPFLWFHGELYGRLYAVQVVEEPIHITCLKDAACVIHIHVYMYHFQKWGLEKELTLEPAPRKIPCIGWPRLQRQGSPWRHPFSVHKIQCSCYSVGVLFNTCSLAIKY